MATGWAGDGAVQDQIDATVKDGIRRVQSQLPQGPSLTRCAECEAEIPEARRNAIPVFAYVCLVRASTIATWLSSAAITDAAVRIVS